MCTGVEFVKLNDVVEFNVWFTGQLKIRWDIRKYTFLSLSLRFVVLSLHCAFVI